MNRIHAIALILISLSFGTFCLAQDDHAKDASDLDAQIEAARADMRADKVDIIKEVMNFTPQESSAFWPVYEKYASEQKALNDQRVNLVKTYTDRFTTLTDADAKQMTEKSLELDSKRVELKKKYYHEFSEKLSPTTVARFFQVEHRFDLLVDLKVASELPLMLDRSMTIRPSAAVK